MNKRLLGFVFIFVTFFGAYHIVSADTLGDHHSFFVNPSYDASGRSNISATLEYISAHAYFYVDDSYLNSLTPSGRQTLDQLIITAGQDFDTVVYPRETAFWGSEANPGIDNDPRITILLERLAQGTGGYFDTINGYTSVQATKTNQREMISANVLSLANDRFKIFVAHEIQHLISFNQKQLMRNTTEEVWLNELRSQYAITVAGYNDDFRNSDLFQREQAFLENPTDSLTEWPNTILDYASVTLFANYLVDRFGASILQETSHSVLDGIASIDEYLTNHHQAERFKDVFADWVWTNYINNRGRDPKFGYNNPNLQTLHVSLTDNRQLLASGPNNFSYSLKPWQSNWDQFIGDPSAGGKNIKISWQNPAFQVYYADAGTDTRPLHSGDVVAPPSVGANFILMPINESKSSNFGDSEAPSSLALTIEYTNQPATALVSALSDGSLIMHAGTPDIYVIWGSYKRYLAPEVLKFYGLDPNQAIVVSESVFQSYMPSNYVRDVNEKKVYAVWPDSTKHWLNMTAQTFTDSHRDWNSVFIINDLESNFYRIGADIKQ